MRRILALFALAGLACGMLLVAGCGGDGGTGPSNETQVEAIKQAALLQEDCFSLLEDLLAVTDTISAMDSVVKVFRADSAVVMANTNSQGIYVEYACGMRGGIILDYKEDPSATGPSPLSGGREETRRRDRAQSTPRATRPDPQARPVLGAVPADKRTVILNPHYHEREEYTDLLVASYDEHFPMAGFYEPETYFNEECRLEKYTFLGSYGIVHFYSHGWAWPDESLVATVYMMTGETVNEQTSNTYWRDIIGGDIPLVIGEHGYKYYIGPDFVAKWNNFEPDTTLIYGGFCYSHLGGWPVTMIEAGAGGYFGFNWSVYTNWNAGWALSLFAELTDTLRIHPMTASGWMYNTPYMDKMYDDEESPYGFVGIYYYGLPDLALFRTRVQVDLSSVDEVWVDLMADIDWDCDSPRPNLSIHKVTRPVGIATRTFEAEWDFSRTFTGGVPVQDIGRMYIRFNPAFTEIDSFFVTNTYHYYAEDEVLNAYGYPLTKTQSYGGHDLPIWVNEPDMHRYIYGVQGRDAGDHVDLATCTYSFPDGTSCVIDDYEFTDEVLQMMRFDFHID